MNKYQNILVIADAIESDQAALSRALYLAAQQDSVKIKVLLVIYDLSYELTSLLSNDERETMQEAILAEEQKAFTQHLKQQFPNAKFSLKLVWHNRPFESILTEASDFNHDLIVKSTHLHNKLSAVVFTPTDWHLLRKSKCPVLLVKDHEWPVNGNIVAAVQVSDSPIADEKIDDINQRVIAEALSLEQLLSANAHIVNAYPTTPEHISIEIPNFDSVTYNQEIQENHTNVMYDYAEKRGIMKQNVHVRTGTPEDVISDVVAEVDAELLVLGAPSRVGLSAFLIGNTAEMVIDSINCDLLALK